LALPGFLLEALPVFAPTFNLRSREVMLAAHADDESPALFVLGPMKPGVALSMERRHDIDNRVSPP
jgi:hypothetical protein